MQYLDFELSVDARGDREYEVSVRSPSGQTRARVLFPFEPAQLAAHLHALGGALEVSRSTRDVVVQAGEGAAAQHLDAVRRFGQALFGSLMTERVLVAYRASGAMAASEEKGLRLQLRIQAPEMAALPWEFMFDQDDGLFVCLNPRRPLVRYPELDQVSPVLSIKPPLRILGMVSSPGNLARLDKDGERSRIERALKQLQANRMVELHWVKGGTYRDLQTAMRNGPWHIFHFIGHGDFEGGADTGGIGVVALESTPSMVLRLGATRQTAAGPDTGAPAHFVSAEIMGQLLGGDPSLRLVVLNSCLGARANAADVFSSAASTLVRRGIPAVVAMQYEITDRAAVAFAQAFYASLAAWTPVDRAVVDARAAINAQERNSVEWGIPVLLMRSPSGALFSPTEARPLPSPPLPRPPLPSARKWWIGAVALAPLGVAAALAVIRAPHADITLDAQVSQIGVVLPASQPLGDPIDVRELGASGLTALDLPQAMSGGGRVTSDRALLTALRKDSRQGRINLDLTTVLAAGTRVTLAASNEPGVYELSLRDSIPEFRLGVFGPVRIVLPGGLKEDVDFPTPAIVRLHPDAGVLGLDFAPAAGARSNFADRLPANGLDLTRLDRFESSNRTMLREVSTIKSGRLAFESRGGQEQELGPSEELLAGGVQGDVRQLELAGDHLRVKLQARVERLSVVSGAARRNLMPSLLELAMAEQGTLVVGAAILYVVGIGLFVFRWWREAS